MELIYTYLSDQFYYHNIYYGKYIKLIESNLIKEKIKFKTNIHHIIPRYMKKFNINTGVIDSEDNLINLSISDHALAHFYLYKCSKNNLIKLYNIGAVRKIVNNYRTPISEDWLLQNKDIIDSINENISELIKINHHDCKGGNNSRAKKAYLYDIEGNRIKEFSYTGAIVKDLDLNISPSAIGYYLVHYPIFIYKEYILSRKETFDYVNFNKCISNLNKYKDNWIDKIAVTPDDIISFKAFKKDKIVYTAKCECCGKEYSRKIYKSKLADYENKLISWYCNDCCSIGSRIKGKSISDNHKKKISASRKGTKWINNLVEELQVPESEVNNYISKGYTLGQLPKVKIIKEDKIRSISVNHLDKYKSEGWIKYEKRPSN